MSVQFKTKKVKTWRDEGYEYFKVWTTERPIAKQHYKIIKDVFSVTHNSQKNNLETGKYATFIASATVWETRDQAMINYVETGSVALFLNLILNFSILITHKNYISDNSTNPRFLSKLIHSLCIFEPVWSKEHVDVYRHQAGIIYFFNS